jgi:hypothetical protein
MAVGDLLQYEPMKKIRNLLSRTRGESPERSSKASAASSLVDRSPFYNEVELLQRSLVFREPQMERYLHPRRWRYPDAGEIRVVARRQLLGSMRQP